MWKSGVKINQFIEADFIRHHLQMSTDYLLDATSGAGTAYASRAPEWSPPVFSGVHVTRSLVLCVCFVDRCVSFCTFSFGHCVVCSSIYGFWLPLWYLQTLLILSTWLYLDTHTRCHDNSISTDLYLQWNYFQRDKLFLLLYFEIVWQKNMV